MFHVEHSSATVSNRTLFHVEHSPESHKFSTDAQFY